MASKDLVLHLAACLAILVALIIGSVALGSEEQVNSVANGGFEAKQGDGDDPANWNATRPALMREYFSFGWDSETFHSGQRSASISIRDNHPDVQIHYNWNQAPLDCEPGDSYEITGWVKAQKLTESAFLAVQCWDRGMRKVLGSANTEHETQVVGTTGWVQVKATFTVPLDTWRVVILAGISGHSNRGGKVWFDDIVIVRAAGD